MRSGLAVLFAALVMMAGLLAEDFRTLHTWSDASTPAFWAQILAHFGAVGTAFLGGKLIPTDRRRGGMRKTDPDA